MDGKRPSNELMTHCRRELIHAQWDIMMDDEFIEAYVHGIIVECTDSALRRFYPRFFTYSADYKEKYVLYCLLFPPSLKGCADWLQGHIVHYP